MNISEPSHSLQVDGGKVVKRLIICAVTFIDICNYKILSYQPSKTGAVTQTVLADVSASHGMFRLLPWSSAIGGNKVTVEEAKILAAKQRQSPVMEVPLVNKLKRKRADSGDSDTGRTPRSPAKIRSENVRSPAKTRTERAHQVVVPKMNGTQRVSQQVLPNDHKKTRSSVVAKSPPSPKSQPAPHNMSQPQERQDSTAAPASALSPAQLDSLRQSIESQLSLEILLKHDELRLIDQEIAKCQIALEQLRRCQEIPYPATSLHESVRNGKGPAVSPMNSLIPESPAPWGVSDGPYTRHYAKWLLPDPRFDGLQNEPVPETPMPAGKTTAKGRATRGSLAEVGYVAGKSRAHRGSSGSKLQSLSSGYPQPRDKAGPLIQRRKSDGQVVKLVCLDCRRDNFSSAQGFINHCRIAHGRGFASHDAATDACGEPVEVDEAGVVIGGNNEPPSTASAGFVHPLIRSAHLTKAKLQAQKPSKYECSSVQVDGVSDQQTQSSSPANTTSSRARRRGRKPNHQSSSTSSAFVPSPETPFLSALMQQKGVGVDLGDIVMDAMTKVEFDVDSSGDEYSEEVDEGVLTDVREQGRLTVRAAGGRQPAQATMSPASLDRPSSRKGLDKASRKPRYLGTLAPPQPPYTSPYAPTAEQALDKQSDEEVEMMDNSPTNLSPNTLESNQAPSLVSDDGEYEAHSESESPSSAEADEDAGDLDIEVEDDESATTTTTTTDPELANSVKPHAHPVRRASAFRRRIGGREEKHVSFVSPSPARDEVVTPKKGGRRKSKG